MRNLKFLVSVLLAVFFVGGSFVFAGSDSLPKMHAAFTATNKIEYLGYAAPGSNESLSPSGFFQIRKFTYDASDNMINWKWADGNAKYDNSWANRAALNYE